MPLKNVGGQVMRNNESHWRVLNNNYCGACTYTIDQYPSHDIQDSSRQSRLAESFSHLLKEMWNGRDVTVVKALRLFKVPIA